LSSTVSNKYLLNNYQICQDFQETNIIKPIAFGIFDVPMLPEQREKMFAKKYRIFSNIEDWRSFVSQFSFTIGNRVHGSVMSLNAGVPAVCCNCDSRAAEMCKLLHVPVRLDINYHTDIVKVYEDLDVDAINNSYPALYDNYVEFLHKNGVEISNPISNIKPDMQPSITLYKDFKDDLNWQNQVRLRMGEAALNKKVVELDTKLKKLEILQNETASLQDKLNLLVNDLIYKPKVSTLEQIFSVKNEKSHKVVRLLGIKIKLRRTK